MIYTLREPNNIYDFIRNNNNITIGDKIEYLLDNQMGIKIYELLVKDGNYISLKIISDWSFYTVFQYSLIHNALYEN